MGGRGSRGVRDPESLAWGPRREACVRRQRANLRGLRLDASGHTSDPRPQSISYERSEGHLLGQRTMGGSEILDVRADVGMVGLGRPTPQELDGVVRYTSSGGGGGGADPERVAGKLVSGVSGLRQDSPQMVQKPVSCGHGTCICGKQGI